MPLTSWLLRLYQRDLRRVRREKGGKREGEGRKEGREGESGRRGIVSERT
jgi:hypothetical protein